MVRIIIEEGSPYKDKLLTLLGAEYSKNRTGTHVSDLLYCIREQVFRKLDPKPITDRELSSFAFGEGAHLAVQRLATTGVSIAEKEIHLEGVQGTVDLFDSVPIEIKTVRSKDDSVRSFHITQLKYYMAMVGSNVGILFYLMVNDYDNPFRFRTITLNNEELDQTRKEILERADQYNKAMGSRDAFMAPHIKKDRKLLWKCDYCKYKTPCYAKKD